MPITRRPSIPGVAVAAAALGGLLTSPAPAQEAPAPSVPDAERESMTSIRAATVLPTIRFLASNGLEGREAGRDGARIAADYLVSRFQSIGLEPGTKGGYLQPFELRYRVLGEGARMALEQDLDGARRQRELDLREEWTPLAFSEEGQVEAPVVFAGYGIEAPEEGWNDYAGLTGRGLRGKAVLVFRHEPDEEGTRGSGFFAGREMTLHASLRQKARVAAAHGAAALIVVDDPLHHGVGDRPSAARWRTLGEEDRRLPRGDDVWYRGRPDTSDAHEPLGIIAVQASQEILRWLDPERDWKELQQTLDRAGRARRLTFPGVTATIVHDVDENTRTTSNVLAVLRGSDPELAAEHVIIGGHYDHVGETDQGEIFNGADDNASGTAAIVAVAEAFARLPNAPARSVLFACWGAEEKGLLGSNWFVHHPPLDLDRIVAGINLDMIGRNEADRMSVVGRTETPDLVALFDRFAPMVELSLNDDAGAGASRSDNASLWLAGIPTASLFSGTHDDYHQPGDTAGKIVPSKVEAAARLTFLVASEIAHGRATPEPLSVPRGPWAPIAPESRLMDDGDSK